MESVTLTLLLQLLLMLLMKSTLFTAFRTQSTASYVSFACAFLSYVFRPAFFGLAA